MTQSHNNQSKKTQSHKTKAQKTEPQSKKSEGSVTFKTLGCPDEQCELLLSLGYETPTPIQEEVYFLPYLQVENVLGQAQDWNRKTAASHYHLSNTLDISKKIPQVLVLAPTRELAIQVSESFQTYARGMRGLNVTAIFGGEPMPRQLSRLKRGPQIVVGTPGRVMDHLRRKTLKLDGIKAVVLDEADEMLNMGFLEMLSGS